METLTSAADQEVVTTGPGGSPFEPRNLLLLWSKPTRFFTSNLDLGAPGYFIPAVLVAGISRATGRVDSALIREELGHGRPGWDLLAPVVTESWLGYWLIALIAGVMGAAFLWYIGGWWYHVRIQWSGHKQPEKRLARLVYSYSLLVQAAPTLLLLLVQTLLYENYLAVWNSDELVSAILIVFPFWSCVTSYKGVRARFDVKAGWARFWFLVLPLLLYTFAFGVIGVLYAIFS